MSDTGAAMNLKKFFLSFGITLLVLAVIFSSMVLFSVDGGREYNFLDSNTGKNENILVVGVDKDGIRADVIMLLSINKEDRAMNLISIPRDTKVKLSNGKVSKINACLGKEDGDEVLVEACRMLTGVSINHYCKVNFEGLRNIVDILGGIEYNVPIDMDYDDPVQDLHIHLKKGKQLLSGADVEGLVRFRSGYNNADLGRIDTQQDFLKEAMRQKLSLRYIFKLPAVMREVNKNFETDVTMLDVLTIAFNARSCHGVSSYTLPGEAKYTGGVSYFVADKDVREQVAALIGEDFIPSGLNDKIIE